VASPWRPTLSGPSARLPNVPAPGAAMADSEQEKTEEPTEKRRREAVEEGRVPRSQDLNVAVLLLASALTLNATGPALGAALRDIMGTGLGLGDAAGADATAAVSLIRLMGWKALGALAGLLASLAGAALAVGALQARGVFTTKTLAPKFERINPAANLKRILGMQGLMEFLKSLLKLAIVGWAVYGVLSAAWQDVAALGQEGPMALLAVVRKYGVGMLRNAGLAYLALAGLDYGFQIWQHQKSLRMTKEEVKQEHKNSEGDPMVKSRMRALARQRARQQMFRDVPKADVVLVNPVHIAVALKYDPEKAPAPVVVAAGRRKVAERIKALAFESEVPVVENVPLARALIASVKVGMMIPAELYLAVAEVLAYVMRQKGARGVAA
jgi:flagellar biosynthesis protein FlhB